jgi:diguanylate cyclase (GGDEF)-like protein/PAS domain S-box-containing protein
MTSEFPNYHFSAELEAIFNATPDSVSVFMLDEDANTWRFFRANEAYGRTSGLRVDELPGKDFREVLGDSEATELDGYFRQCLSSGKPCIFEAEHTYHGKPRVLHVNVVPFLFGGAHAIMTTTRDITDLHHRSRLLQVLVENMPDSIYIKDARTMQYVLVNRAAEEMFGLPRGQIIGKRNSDVFSGEAVKRFISEDENLIRSGGIVQVAIDEVDRDVIYDRRKVLIKDEEGAPEYILGISRDITATRRAEEHIRYLSSHDTLTGLHNRAFFEEKLCELSRESDFPVSIVLMDMDGLKVVNDTIGHRSGDDLLRTFAAVLKSAFRSTDIVARFGGDEFAVLLPHTDLQSAEAVCKRLEQKVEQYNSGDPPVRLGVSTGVACAHSPGTSLQEVLHEADRNMYAVKERRRKADGRSQ